MRLFPHWLVILACGVGNLHADFRLTGEMTVTTPVETRTMPFQVCLGDAGWRIQTTAEGLEYISGTSGGEVGHIKRVSKDDAEHEFAWMDTGAFPSRHYGTGQALWLAFCSSKFIRGLPRLKNLSGKEFPRLHGFEINEEVYDDISTSLAVEHDVLVKADFTGSPKGIASWLGGGYLAAQFRVTGFTEKYGLTFPGGFEWVRYLPPHIKNPKTGSPIAEKITAQVDRIEQVPALSSYLPEIHTDRLPVIDARFGDAIQYVVTDKRWCPAGSQLVQRALRESR